MDANVSGAARRTGVKFKIPLIPMLTSSSVTSCATREGTVKITSSIPCSFNLLFNHISDDKQEFHLSFSPLPVLSDQMP